MQEKDAITADDIYQRLGGDYAPSPADQSLSPDVIDIAQVLDQGAPTNPSLMNRSRLIDLTSDLGLGNISQIADAEGKFYGNKLRDDMIGDTRNPEEVAQIYAALKGDGAYTAGDYGVLNKFTGKTTGAGYSDLANQVDQTLGIRGAFKGFNNYQKALIAQRPEIASDPKELAKIADVMTRASVLRLLNEVPAAKINIMKVFKDEGMDGVTRYIDSLKGVAGGKQPAAPKPVGRYTRNGGLELY